jgi:hypothetical protein
MTQHDATTPTRSTGTSLTASVETVNRIVFVGDFGVREYQGPFDFNTTPGLHGVEIPTSPDAYGAVTDVGRRAMLYEMTDEYVVAMADAEAISGGPVEDVNELDTGCIGVAYDPHARADDVADALQEVTQES